LSKTRRLETLCPLRWRQIAWKKQKKKNERTLGTLRWWTS
jgi:hypothetical protein